MLSRRLVRLGRRIIPKFLQDEINPFDQFMERAIERFITYLPARSVVLDAGAGEAQYKPLVEARGHRYVAIDLGVGEPDWGYHAIDALANTEDLPFPEATFHGIMSIAVLEHTPFPRKVLHELNRALRPQGVLLIVVPTMWEEHQMPNDFYRFTRYGLQKLLEEAGFEVIEMIPIGGYFWFMGRKSIDILEFFQPMPRRLLWPLLAPVFGVLIPIVCRHLDWLDKDKFYTIGQVSLARKIAPAGSLDGASILP